MFVCWLKYMHLSIMSVNVESSCSEVSALNFEPRDPLFELQPGRRLLWPWESRNTTAAGIMIRNIDRLSITDFFKKKRQFPFLIYFSYFKCF